MIRRRRNPNPNYQKYLKVGVVIAAGYGILSAYNKIKDGGDDTMDDTRTPRQRCIDEGGVWMPYPAYLPDETGTAGYCAK